MNRYANREPEVAGWCDASLCSPNGFPLPQKGGLRGMAMAAGFVIPPPLRGDPLPAEEGDEWCYHTDPPCPVFGSGVFA
jgi:hypothetical protein